MTSPNLPEIEAEVITPLADMSRGAGLGERAGAAAFSQAAQTFSDIGGMLTHYQKGVDDGERAKIRSAVDYDLDKLAAEHKGDPQGFETAAAKLRTELISRVPSRYAGVTGAYVDTLGKQRSGTLYMQRAQMDTESAKSALEQRKSVLEGTLQAYQRQGPSALQTPEYQAAFGEYSEVLTSLGNPLFGSSPAESQARIEVAKTRQITGAALTEARDIYAKEGLASARGFIERTINDPTLNLSAYDRQQLENGAREEINLMHQATIETERETRQAEQALKASQRETTDDLMLDAVLGTLNKGTVMAALAKGDIEDGQAARLLKAIKATARSAGGSGASAPKEGTLKAITAAAGGDKEAAKEAMRLAERGVIDPGEAADVANAYRTAKKNPAIAAGVDFISQQLTDRGDDRKGAIAFYMKQAGLGLIPPGKETQAAQDAITKHQGRSYSTLPAPLFGWTPRTDADVAKSAAKARAAYANGRISAAVYQNELATLQMWKSRVAMTVRK